MGVANVEAAQFVIDNNPEVGPWININNGLDGGQGDIPAIEEGPRFRYNGFIEYKNEFWLVEDGLLTGKTNGLAKGYIKGEENWWYVEDSKVDFSADTLAKNSEGWWKITDGTIDYSFTGMAENSKGTWYVTDGYLDQKFCGIVELDGVEWIVVNGKANTITKAKDMTLYRAFKVIEEITTEKMTREQKLKACWDFVQSQEETNARYPHYTGMDWPMVYAEDVFMTGKGNCISMGAALCYMAKALGYKEVYACNSGEHGWAEIDGLIYDPEWALHHTQYNYYGISYDDQTDQNYRDTLLYCTESGYEWTRIKI